MDVLARPARRLLTIPLVPARDNDSGRGEFLTRRAGWLAFAAFAAMVLIGFALRLPDEPTLAAVAAAASLAAGVLLVRASAHAVLPFAALATAGVAALASGTASNVGWFAVCVLAGWCVLAGGRRAGLTFLAGSLLLFGGEWLWASHDPGWGAWAVGTTFTALAALLVRHERLLVAQLRAAQAGLAERSRAEERNRIARELHDVIAHSLTVSLLHVSSARLAVEYDPGDAARSLAEAERLGRQSLSEVRSIMGVPGSSSGDAIAAPVPGIDGVHPLIEQFRSAGAGISLTAEGDTGWVPATTGSTAYRIVQEALTNAAKHAPGSAITVRVAARRDQVELIVDSAGPPGAGAGIGLLTMRERAEAVGGRCIAGPRGDGWRVQATLPIDSPLEPTNR
jgi:signal transduction histidine kinase